MLMHECAGSVITRFLKRWTTFAIGLLLGWGSRVMANNGFNTEAFSFPRALVEKEWMTNILPREERINEK